MSDSIEWATGLFEGEGTILWQRQGAGFLRLALKMTDEDIVRRFHAAVRGGVVHGPYQPHERDGSARKVCWIWRADGEIATRILREMAPLLGERRSQTAERHLFQQAMFEVPRGSSESLGLNS